MKEDMNGVCPLGGEFDFVYRRLRRNGIGVVDAEDLAQDVFLVTWRRWAEYDQSRPLRAWLAGIAFRLGKNHRKRSRRRETEELIDAVDPQSQADERLASAELKALALRGLESLPPRQPEILIMR